MLYIDIETIPDGEPLPLESFEANKTTKEEEKIRQQKINKQESEYRSRALHPLKGKIVCIAFAFYNEKIEVVYGDDEEKLIRDFIKSISNFNDNIYPMVGHNIKAFDWPFINARLMKYGIKNTFIKEHSHLFDTIRLTADFSYRTMYSLKDLATFLGYDAKQDMEGSEVYDYWKEGEHEKVAEYCVQDVETLRLIHSRYLGL